MYFVIISLFPQSIAFWTFYTYHCAFLFYSSLPPKQKLIESSIFLLSMNGETAFGWKGKVLSHHNNIVNTETILCHSNASINDQPQWFCTNQFNPQERPKQHPFVMMVISVTMFCQLVLSLDLMLFNVDVPAPVLCADKLTPLHLVQITFHSFIQHHTSPHSSGTGMTR